MKLVWIACLCAFLTLQMSIIMNSYQLDAQLQTLRALQEETASNRVNLSSISFPTPQSGGQSSQSSKNLITDEEMRDKFLKSMKGQGSDKVTTHHYDLLYGKYLAKLKNTGRKIKLLEIGFGCDFRPPYGTPGGSARAWREVFGDQIEIHLIEYDGNCVKEWDKTIKDNQITAYVGSQSDRAFLRDVIKKSGGSFDLVVEDGGHTMLQQRVSTEELFTSLKPGGYFFLEDLQTAFLSNYNPDNTLKMTEVIKSYIDWLMGGVVNQDITPAGGDGNSAYVKDIISFECMAEMCVFTRKQ